MFRHTFDQTILGELVCMCMVSSILTVNTHSMLGGHQRITSMDMLPTAAGDTAVTPHQLRQAAPWAWLTRAVLRKMSEWSHASLRGLLGSTQSRRSQ